MNDTLSIGGFSTTPLELLSVVLSVATVVLNIRRNHWAWLFAIVSSAAYAVVFFGARLYGDAGLQGAFIATAGWGWYTWLRGADGTPLHVGRLDRAGLAGTLGGGAAGALRHPGRPQGSGRGADLVCRRGAFPRPMGHGGRRLGGGRACGGGDRRAARAPGLNVRRRTDPRPAGRGPTAPHPPGWGRPAA